MSKPSSRPCSKYGKGKRGDELPEEQRRAQTIQRKEHYLTLILSAYKAERVLLFVVGRLGIMVDSGLKKTAGQYLGPSLTFSPYRAGLVIPAL